MQREKELCFNYDEKFTRGHKCSSWFFLLIADPEDDGEPSDDNPNTEATSSTQLTLDPPQDQISFYALSGHLAPETLHLLGWVSHHSVVILIDGGSMHNFVQERLVHSLGLSAQPTHPLRVVVGNGNEIACHHLCSRFSIHIQSQMVEVPWPCSYRLQ